MSAEHQDFEGCKCLMCERSRRLRNLLGQPKPKTPQSAKYEEEMGVTARVRQEGLAKDRFVCCGELKDGEHHEACSKWKRIKSAVIDGQGSLI